MINMAGEYTVLGKEYLIIRNLGVYWIGLNMLERVNTRRKSEI